MDMQANKEIRKTPCGGIKGLKQINYLGNKGI